jgi:CheY-specific phosphatase CheX
MTKHELIKTLETSTVKMFTESGEVIEKSESAKEMEAPEDLVVVISFNGDAQGQVVLYWEMRDALKFASDKNRVFCGIDEPYTEVTSEVVEIIAEFTNEIAGAFLTDLSKHNIFIKILTPIIYQSGHVVYPDFEHSLKTHFICNGFSMYIGLYVDKAKIIKN